MYVYMRKKKEDIDEVQMEEKRKVLRLELVIWEKYCDTEFVAGDEFTMADIFFFCYLAVLVRGNLSLDGRPNLKRYYEKISARPSLQASWPPHYKSTPPTNIFSTV